MLTFPVFFCKNSHIFDLMYILMNNLTYIDARARVHLIAFFGLLSPLPFLFIMASSSVYSVCFHLLCFSLDKMKRAPKLLTNIPVAKLIV